MISKKHRKVCKTLTYVQHLLILASANFGFISISALASLIGSRNKNLWNNCRD